MKKSMLLVAILMILLITAIPTLAITPDPNDPNLLMYANAYTAGAVVGVNFDPYVPAGHPLRLNPGNALGVFDAVQTNGDARFFGLAARTWTKYTFPDKFVNVDVQADIRFSEVTWDSTWHTEAAKVYLTDAYIRNAEGKVVPYTLDDDGDATNGTRSYYAGVVWNKMGINGVSAAKRLLITQSYFAGTRDFEANTFVQQGNFGISLFNLPDEVVYATGIILVDITKDVYAEFNPATYLNVGGLNNGHLVTLLTLDPLAVNAVYGTDGNTDGYDLDAIRVYKYIPWRFDDTATGICHPISAKGNWFGYSIYPGGEDPYPIQAGNPKNGMNKIGDYSIESLGNGWYVARYSITPTIWMNGYTYDIVVAEEHLAISDSMSFTGKPGKDDNWDFGDSFDDADGHFYIFAHFAVEYH
ncbi:MAG: hypothetical protein ACYC0V_08940 [Armatimonadota bacterium]